MTSATAVAAVVLLVILSTAATPSLAQNSPQDFVGLHNAARAVEGVGEVVWDDAVAAYAESYAATRRGDCQLIHSGSFEAAGYGENLFGGGGDGWSAADAVNMWVGEKDVYDYDSNSCIGSWDSCVHYTQVMWSRTTAIGCARVVCDNDGGVFITCNYNPSGNFQGERPFERGLTLSA
uniref:SCP domain-containing protein n=1 Tax=Leersia perrieri TaxID=77586 RepID=A0A0D9WV49_9ORYZ